MKKMLFALATALVLVTYPGALHAGGSIALTFDDGPNGRLTPRLLDILREEGVTATFCVVGQNTRALPSIVARMAREGCNHTWDHPILSSRNVSEQIGRTDDAIRHAAGFSPTILRAPFGEIHYVGRCYARRPFVGWGRWNGHKYVGGDTLDWKYRFPARITRVAVDSSPGTIILMHDIHPTTIAAVRGIIRGLKARGMTFVHASDLWHSSCGR